MQSYSAPTTLHGYDIEQKVLFMDSSLDSGFMPMLEQIEFPYGLS